MLIYVYLRTLRKCPAGDQLCDRKPVYKTGKPPEITFSGAYELLRFVKKP